MKNNQEKDFWRLVFCENGSPSSKRVMGATCLTVCLFCLVWLTIKEGGNTKKINKKLAVLKKLLQNALNGKSADIKMALELADKIENDLSRTQFDDNEQSKIDSEIIENYRKSILQENKEVEI